MNRMLNRVPEVTLYFWIIKIMATTVGETGADFLAFTMNFGLAATSYLMAAILAVVLWNQFRLKRYIPVSYWAVVVLVSIVGTLITDRLVDEMGVSLVTITIIFTLGLLALFAVWYQSEKTLAMHSIKTTKRELFYWAAILLTFALGTAAGDLLAEGLSLGYAVSALVFGGVIAIIAVAYYRFGMNAVLTFWLTYVLTRPLGASIGDLLSQPVKNGGLGFGTVGTTISFITTIAILIIYMTIKQKKPAQLTKLPSDS